MARSKKQLIGKWVDAGGDFAWVYKSGRSFYLSHGGHEHLCHPSVRNLEDTKREAMLVYQFKAVSFASAGV